MKEVIIISGGANGLGFELVKLLYKRGYFICNIDKDEKKLNHIENQFLDNYKAYLGNIADEDFIIDTVKDISKIGKIIAVINNAGSPVFKLPTEYLKKDIDLCFEGLNGMILLTTNTLKQIEKNAGKIINILSSAALRGNKQESVYCATKWAERGFTESLRDAYNGTNIQIYGVYPGGINTNIYKNSRDYVSLEKQSKFMSPRDVAEVIVEIVFNNKNLIIEDIVINRIK